ncbi:MAG: hypothetical protein MJ185_08970 [Treponema sp.]|nr:hypothetical protein [Treponema sp.]
MKHKARLILIYLFFLTSLCFSQENNAEKVEIPHGIELCRQVRTICKASGLDFSTQTLVSSLEIFNISVFLPAFTRKPDSFYANYRNTLVFILPQEEFIKKSEFYTNILKKLSAQKRNYDIVFLLSFSENNRFQGFYTLTGEKTFLQTLDSAENYAAIFLHPGEKSTKVISGAQGLVTPSWLVKTTYDSINRYRLLPSIKSCYISFLYKQKIFNDSNLESFLSAGIPSLSLHLSNKIDDSSFEDFIIDFCNNYDLDDTVKNDTHSIMFTAFHKSFWITEETITKEILIVIFLTFMLLILYGFLNSNLQFIAWNKIKKIWYYPIIIYGICIFIFYTFRLLIIDLRKGGILISTASAISSILPMIFTVQSFFFFSTLRFTPYFHRRTVDYLTLITASINLAVFSLIDISLFPIFGLEFIFAWLSTVFTLNFVHIIILILFELPFIPFILQFFENASPNLLDSIVRQSRFLAPAVFLMLLPQYLNSFRVFTGMNFYWFNQNKLQRAKDRNNLIILAVFLCSFELILFLMLPPYLKQTNSGNVYETLISSDEKIITANIFKRKIFDENLTTLIIHSEKKLEACDIRVKGQDSNPILFSDNEFIISGQSESVFPLPMQPPEDLIFSFGTGNDQAYEITIRSVYKENDSFYINETKAVSE